MKKCTICKMSKPYSDFHRQASRSDGYGNWCKPCKSVKKAEQYQAGKDHVKARVAKYREDNPEKVAEAKRQSRLAKLDQYRERERAHYWNNRETALARAADYRENNHGKLQARRLDYRQRNRQQLSAKQSHYYRDNREDRLRYHAAYTKERRKTDPLYAMSFTVRRRISLAITNQGYLKTSLTREMLGCDYSHLMAHLESQFAEGMSWDNRGEWHIDHIIPLASAETEGELLALCHYTNLQPLWAFDNLSKGAKMPDRARKAKG